MHGELFYTKWQRAVMHMRTRINLNIDFPIINHVLVN